MKDNILLMPRVLSGMAGVPDQKLIQSIEKLLELAKSGSLQSFIGTGFTAGGDRCALWADFHPDVYQMLGALSWLQHEYVHARSS